MLPDPRMMKKLIKGRLVISVPILVLALYWSATAQHKHWHEIKGNSLIKFDWNCASPSVYPKAKLGRHVDAALKHEAAGGTPDRAFVFDLNGDGKREYFVPLLCGATGNCTWGVFALGPARFLGTVNGQYVYVHKHTRGWPRIITYGHLSAMEGVIDTYLFRSGRYALSGKGYPIGPEDRTLEIQSVTGHKMPRFLDRARAACSGIGG